MSEINPFPEYPVSRLDENPAATDQRTVPTEPIRHERKVIRDWCGHPSRPLIVAVRGDYGSGKTHLLLDAMATLGDCLKGLSRPYTFLPVAALAESPLGWYQAAIGPRLAGLPLEDLVVRLYAEAGKDVARRAELTEAAVSTLDRKPEAILNLVREELLSPTAVEEVFQQKLAEAAPDAHDDILRALELLRWDNAREARQWLAGGELPIELAGLLDLPSSIDTDERALEALLAVAALHSALDRVFGLFVDEVEHFLGADGRGGKSNATSMKRLLEGLAKRKAIVFVAGDWSAWEMLPDYLDRFSPSRPIDLLNLTGNDVRRIVAARVPSAAEFGTPESTLVAQLGNGNMRSIMSLLRELYERSGGFTQSPSPVQIEEAADSISRRPTPQTALLRVRELLDTLGFSVEPRMLVAGAMFDLVASRGNRVTVVVELKHATHELAQGDQVKRMIDQMREVNKIYPEAVGCFLSEGRLDEAVRQMLAAGSAQRILLSDVTGPDFIIDLSRRLTSLLEVAEAPAELAQLDSARLQAMGEIGQLQTDREQELDRILDRDPARTSDLVQIRDSGLQTPRADYRDRLAVTYEELTRPVTLGRRLSHVWHPLTVGYLFMVGLGLFVTIFTAAQGVLIYVTSMSYAGVEALQYLVSFMLITGGLLTLIRDFNSVERFYEFRNRRLRSIYLRSEDVEELISVNDSLEEALDRAGPRWSALLL